MLLLDEPTAHLDPDLTARVLDLLARDPRSVLLVTHDPAALDDRWRVVDLAATGLATDLATDLAATPAAVSP